MASESGYSNTKKQGQPQHKTFHDLGSSRIGQHTVSKSLAERNSISVAIVSVTPGKNAKNEPLLKLEITGHPCKKGDILRFISGTIQGAELEIISIVDVDNIVVRDILDDQPLAGDLVKSMFYVTSKSDAEGNVNFSPGPTQFVRDGSPQQVIEDTVDLTQNKPLPAGLYFVKDGVAVPVTKDTVTPSNTAAMPVEIVAVDGTTINVTAGDINVQLSAEGPTFDSTRIGDGTGFYLNINPDGSINVQDAAALAELQTLVSKDFATEATLTAQNVLIGAVNEAAPASDVASAGLNGRLQRIAQRISSLMTLFPSSIGQKVKADSLSVTLASDQGSLAVTGPLTDAQLRLTPVPVSGPLTDAQMRATALDVASTQLPATLGQHTPAQSVSVVLASGSTISTSADPLAAKEAKQDTQITLLGAVSETAPASDLADSGINGRLKRIAQNITSTFALFGAVNETAPASDIASSGLNGRLQRVAQRLSTLITDIGLMSAKLPAAIGSLPANQSLSVVLPTDQSPVPISMGQPGTGGLITNKITVGTTAIRATSSGGSPSVNRKKLFIKPHKDNTGNIYLGSSLVSTTIGLEIIGPDRLEFDGYYDMYLVSDVVGQKVEIMELL